MGSKNNDVVIRCRLLRLCQKIHRPSVNRFDSVILWHGFDNKNKSQDDRMKIDVIDGIIFQAEAKRFIVYSLRSEAVAASPDQIKSQRNYCPLFS